MTWLATTWLKFSTAGATFLTLVRSIRHDPEIAWDPTGPLSNAPLPPFASYVFPGCCCAAVAEVEHQRVAVRRHPSLCCYHATADRPSVGLAVSPDGKSLLYVQNDQKGGQFGRYEWANS